MRKIIGQVRTPWIWMVAALLASPASSAQAQVASGPLPWNSTPAARVSAVQAAVAGPTCPLTFLHYSRCGASEICQLSCSNKTMWDLVNGKPRTLTPTDGGCADGECPDGVCDTRHLYTYYAEDLAQCDGSTKANPADPYGGDCVCYDMAGSGTTDFPAYETDIATGCSAATPREVCSNSQDDNCNGRVDCADTVDCPGGVSCGTYGKICGSGASSGTCICPTGTKEICDDGLDNNCNGLVDDDCPETCGDGIDNNANGAIDDTCTMPDAPPPQACFESDASLDSLSQVNLGCQNGDVAGYDPILLATRSATTEPFTDFEVTPLRTLAVTRSYTSGDVMAGGAAGIFGLGWHHNWETALACNWVGASHLCTVTTGLGGRMAFKARPSTVVGAGALLNEALVLYERVEPENLASGGHNLMVRRPNGEFILYLLDGSELRFAPPSSCSGTYCMNAAFTGALRLTREIDPIGRGFQLDFAAAGRLLTVTDDLGNRLSLLPSGPCSSRVGSLQYRAGSGGVDVEYVTYTYTNSCSTLERVVPAVGHTTAPGKPSQLRHYEYQPPPKPLLLTKVHNEFGDVVADFGYDPLSGRATSLQDSRSSLAIVYPQGNQDVVVNAYGDLQATSTSWRDDSGKASTVLLQPGYPQSAEDLVAGTEEKMHWDGRYLVCFETMAQYVRHFERDAHNRATTIADYGAARFADDGSVTCEEEPWRTKVALRSTSFEYGLTRTIAQGVVLPLSAVTRTSKTSVFGATLAAAAGGGKTASDFKTSETLDYDPTEGKAGDPSGYRCGTAGLPVGGLVCRRFVEGFTKNAAGEITLARIGTFFSYDGRGRLVRVEGPKYIEGDPPAGNVDPVEERTYWPEEHSDLLRRGRLHEIKRWPGGFPSAASALVTTIDLYDAYGPTQVTDEAGGTTAYLRAGGAGRVTRVDTPDGRHVTSRYYDGEQPRLVLLNGGSARRFTYDERGRLHVTEPLSGDPEQGNAVSVGWTETRDHDVAGNTTLLTRADAAGTVRWKQAYEYFPDGQLRKMPHPTVAGSYSRWTRNPAGVLELQWDEDRHVTRTRTDALKRTRQVTFEYEDAVSKLLMALPGGFSYDFEPGQDAIARVSSLTGSAGAPGGTDPVVAEYVHDDFGNLLSVGSPRTMTGGPYLYRYDARGNVVKRSGGGATLTLGYDGLNRLKQLTATRTADSSSVTYTYGYDDPLARGKLHTISEPDRSNRPPQDVWRG